MLNVTSSSEPANEAHLTPGNTKYISSSIQLVAWMTDDGYVFNRWQQNRWYAWKEKKIKVIEWVMKLIRLHGRQCSLVMASTAGKEHAVNTEWLKSCKLWEAAPTTLAMNVSSLKLSLGIFHVQKCQAENSTEQSGRQAHTVVLPYCTQFTDESDVRWTLNFPQFLLK